MLLTIASSFNNGYGAYVDTVNGTSDANVNLTIMWGQTEWTGQTWGRGDGSLDGNGAPTVNATFNATGMTQTLNNVSPKLQGWRDWAGVANAPAAQATGAGANARRWFPGLNRGRS